MEKKDKIIRLYLQGKSKSEISRIVQLSRQTVRKYLVEYEWYLDQIEKANSIDEKEDLIIKSNAKPKYDASNRQRFKVTPSLVDRIKELLAKNEQLAGSNKRKLMMKKKDMHRIVTREGYDLSYRSICSLISELQPKAKEAYIRQDTDPGQMAEFDWGDVSLTIDEFGGGERRYKIGVFALKHSNHLWANLYPHENTECFNDAHARFFEDVGGVPAELVYDNARVQVKQFVGYEKRPSDALVSLSNYYGFGFRFTNFYSGNEKGHVERAMEVVRRRAFCEKQHFSTYADAVAALKGALDEINDEIKQLTGKSANAAFAEEREFLQPSRIRLDVGVIKTCKANKYSLIYVDSNFYSVPDYLVEKEVTVRKYPMYIKVYYNNFELFTIGRIYGRNEYKVDITHYIRTLKKKPGAIRNSLALKQSATWLQEIFHNYFTTKPKDFIALLELSKKFDLDSIVKVIKKVIDSGLMPEISLIEYELINLTNSYGERTDDYAHGLQGDIGQQCINQLLEIGRLYRGATA